MTTVNTQISAPVPSLTTPPPAASISAEDASFLGIQPGVPITPELLVGLLARRLQEQDQQIVNNMNEMDGTGRRASDIARKMEVVKQIRSAMQAAHPDDGHQSRLNEIHVNFEGRDYTADQLLSEFGITDIASVATGDVRNLERNVSDVEQRIGHLEERIADLDSRGRHGHRFTNAQRQLTQARADLAVAQSELREARAASTSGSGMGNNKVTSASMDTLISRYQTQLQDLNSGKEMRMVQLQSQMQQRSQAITLTTQMMKAVTDAMKRIAGNI